MNIFKSFPFVMAFALTTFALSSCEDVPAPYEIPSADGSGSGGLSEGQYINESFSQDFGVFSVSNVSGTPWVISYSTATATGYDSGTKETTPSESYLISEPIDLSQTTEANVQFEYILRYAIYNGTTRPGVANKVLITANYTGDPANTSWTDITGTLTEGSDWDTWYDYAANIPAEFMGQKAVVIALYYSCGSSSATWEVRNLVVADGAVADSGNTPSEPAEGEYLNETFKTSLGSFTEHTTMGTPWVIDFSCAKATGYDNSTQITTPSQSWIVSPAVNLSQATEVNLQFEYILRYVTNYGTPHAGVENKVLITANYTGDPATTSWTDITGTLTEGSDWSTWYNYAVNIPSEFIGQEAVVIALYYACQDNSGTWEVRNLVMADGAVADVPDTPVTPDEPSTGLLSETFASGQGSFTIVDINLGGMNYVWSHLSNYSCMRASAYFNSQNNASESWLVSPVFSLEGIAEPTLTFENAVNYLNVGTLNDYLQLLVSTDYDGSGNVQAATWTPVDFAPLPETNNNFTFVTSTASLADYAGQAAVYIAFRYTSTADCAPSWEVKNLSVTDGTSGGNQGGSEGGGTISGPSITADLSSFGYANGDAVENVTLDDGATLLFAQEGGNNAPKYYNLTAGVRMYALNSLTVTAPSGKTITGITLTCDSYQGTAYVGNPQLYLAACGTNYSPSVSDVTVSFSGFNNAEAKIVNDWTGNSGGTQLRVKTITITYAE